MPDAKNTQALRKRQQIEDANKTMFMWVAIAAAVVGIAAVLAVSLFERISFKQDIINEKNNTVSILKNNNEVADELKEKVRVLNTNQALLDTPKPNGAEPLSVILDALPSTANSSALGASLQQKLLTSDGVSLETLVVDPISGVESNNDNVAVTGDENAINFRFTVNVGGNQESQLRDMLRNIEKSIRVINLTSVSIERLGQDKITLTAEGKAFYQPEVKVELTEKSKRPK